MPNYRGHLVGGTVAYLAICSALKQYDIPKTVAIEWYLFTLIGALFPDIDTKSKGQKLFYRGIFLCSLLLFVQQQFRALSFLCFIALFPLLIRHRGITHSVIFISILSMSIVTASYIWMQPYIFIIIPDVLFFFAGALSHIVLDYGLSATKRIFYKRRYS
jgi:membrane-bound metal-dependent hydrolase YbcI (DUF457 family)